MKNKYNPLISSEIRGFLVAGTGLEPATSGLWVFVKKLIARFLFLPSIPVFSRLCRLNCKWPVYRLFVILFFPFLYFVIRFANLLQMEVLTLFAAEVTKKNRDNSILFRNCPDYLEHYFCPRMSITCSKDILKRSAITSGSRTPLRAVTASLKPSE